MYHWGRGARAQTPTLYEIKMFTIINEMGKLNVAKPIVNILLPPFFAAIASSLVSSYRLMYA